METFAPVRPFVADPDFERERRRALAGLDPADLDPPVRDLVTGFNALACCFTLQCCWGHFVTDDQPDGHNLAPLPVEDRGPVRYRIAYLALCLNDSLAGQRLRMALAGVVGVAPDYVQFGSPGWFWERRVNTYALQVEPERLSHLDAADIDHAEALRVQEVRDRFFVALVEVLQDQKQRD